MITIMKMIVMMIRLVNTKIPSGIFLMRKMHCIISKNEENVQIMRKYVEISIYYLSVVLKCEYNFLFLTFYLLEMK